ncbi:MAG: HNH endonuclease family protein [Candidatus Bathyarchaeales archaeon]
MEEIAKIIQEFREYLHTEEGQGHLNYLKEKEPRETREILQKLKELPKGSSKFVDLVLYGLLPYSNTKYAKRVSVAPAFMNIKKFFARFNYDDDDWRELAAIIYDLVVRFQENPNNLENLIRDFISYRLSKGLQCGSLSPVFFALNSNFPIVNTREIRTYRKLSFLIFGQVDELSERLEYYLTNIEKIKKLTDVLVDKYGFDEIRDMAVFDLFCYWYDEYKTKGKEKEISGTQTIRQKIAPIDETNIEHFFQSLACSDPQPYFPASGGARNLQKLNEENRIIYNTEFQRGEVWDLKRKQKLIDSILRGYNINTVYFRQLPDGKFECLDGQQRLKTLLKKDGKDRGFLYDGFPISPKITPEFNRETYFSELPEYLKSKIRNYSIYVIIFYTDKDDETCRIFLRLQEGLPLNAPEKLNAMRGFLRNEIFELTKHPFMKKLGIRDYRFSHRYILAQAYLLTLRNQITDIKFRNLQEMYETYKQTRPPQTVSNNVKQVLNFLDREFGNDAQVIKYNADFISLYLLAKHLLEHYVISSVVGLKDFFIQFNIKVGEVESSEKEEDVPYYDYKTYRKTSADSRTSIEKRFTIILSKFLEFNQSLQPKDPIRSYDYWEKLAVYWRDKGVCQICGKKTSFEKGTVDHKIPHSRGGPTTIKNGQWACVPCNLSKLNR